MKKIFSDKDDHIVVECGYRAEYDVESPIYGIVISDGMGNRVFSSNNLWQNKKSKNLKKGQSTKVKWTIPNIFNTGGYTIKPAVSDLTGAETYHSIEDMTSFRVRKRMYNSSLTNIKHDMEL